MLTVAGAPARAEAPGAVTTDFPPLTAPSLSHWSQIGLALLPGSGFRVIIPYGENIYCGKPGKRVCTGRVPFFLDVQPSFGMSPHWDVLVDKALIKYATSRFGSKSPGLILVNNAWGDSNFSGLTAAAEAAGIKLAGSEKFEDKDVDMTPQLQRLRVAGADCLILVGNAAPGAQVIKSLQRSAWSVPIVSHWGISGGRFPELAGSWAGKVHFVQTYSFFGQQSDAAYPFVIGQVRGADGEISRHQGPGRRQPARRRSQRV